MNIRRLLPKFIRQWRFDGAVEEITQAFILPSDSAKRVLPEDVTDIELGLLEQCIDIYREYWHLTDDEM